MKRVGNNEKWSLFCPNSVQVWEIATMKASNSFALVMKIMLFK
ncbi:hypothetical protein RchiOBHm_Chr7g0214501 [Rosa chinensis]|uniref:Uncharacterized protein n=1 Tax=Rosa chinensis TaxID=74649 RepID=A0A2P6PB77_ROSCH|nr:hypothetical protein RchiOBHm_Chr7g0214501 [Rosa chinensis]